MPTLEFSKIAVPNASGTPTYVYEVKDSVARAAISGGMNFIIAWDGNSTPVVADIPNTVSVRYNNNVYTGTLDPAVAHSAHINSFWLVSDGEGGYAEYVPVENTDVTPSVWVWEKLGDVALDLSNLGAMAYVDSVELEKGSGVNVIGENATMQAAQSQVNFSGGSTDQVLGAGTTFSATGPTITDNSTTQSLSVVMGPVTVPDTSNPQSVLTGLKNVGSGSNDTKKETFLKSSTTLSKTMYKTANVTGINGTETKSASTGKTLKKLHKTQIVPAKSKSLSGSALVSANTKYLKSKSVNECTGTASVNVVSSNTTKKLTTDTFKKVTTANSNVGDTVVGLSVQMYNSQIHGTIQDADEETLVMSFATTPTLELSSTDTTFATGGLTAQTDDGYSSETGSAVSIVTTTSQNVVTGLQSATVADTALATTADGDPVVTGIGFNSVNVAEPDTAVYLADGTVTDTATTGSEAGDEIVTDMEETLNITVPKAATSATTVVTSTATVNESDNHIDIATGLNTTNNTADAYTDLKFNTQNVIKSTTTATPTAKLKLDDGQASDSVDVVTSGGVSVSGSYSVSANNDDPVTAVTDIGTGTAAAQTISWTSKDLKKVALYDDLRIVTESHPATRYLNFAFPSSGTVTLAKNGNPTDVVIEISNDGVNWTEWQEDENTGNRTKSVEANERLYIRNKSEVSTGFSKQSSGGSLEVDYYQFSVPNGTEVNGMLESLLCKTPELGKISAAAFQRLFYHQRITGKPIINSRFISAGALYRAFDCGGMTPASSLDAVELRATSISDSYGTSYWLNGCADTGILYCPSTLTIANGTSGLPSGWTRVDI